MVGDVFSPDFLLLSRPCISAEDDASETLSGKKCVISSSSSETEDFLAAGMVPISSLIYEK
jgi:hypothetical protein